MYIVLPVVLVLVWYGYDLIPRNAMWSLLVLCTLPGTVESRERDKTHIYVYTAFSSKGTETMDHIVVLSDETLPNCNDI